MTIPYFYIIEHKLSGKKYAGSRWTKNCKPLELLKEDGYKTSSQIIQNIIKEEGLESFEILKIMELDDPYEYETNFLIKNDCANSNAWFNKHNNTGRPPPFGTTEFTTLLKEKYGVEHNTMIPEVKKRMIDSLKKTYKDNPQMTKDRAMKVAEARRRNGTTGKGVPHKKHANNGTVGKWVRTEEHNLSISERQKIQSHFVKNNPMNNVEARNLVSLSKIGRKRIYKEDGTYYMSNVNLITTDEMFLG